ncbi:MAG: hypothetical protein A2163_01015 [Actinobacteria bacterium RBG_13_35_12]|nr:MAG: hypothetical protein A2163_01015 [Actinobacteria bacterium RBG_13_35_12]OFW62758.1 MAG: hypothetical protein A2Z35_02150 [Actinobacteria bacterium RBG_19FT_COMBO_36_27]OGD36472.1 MAG: hypothetical protein A2V94_06080 [Candidatus Atribacteria bacterium RBG_16_35_8]
MHGLFMQQVEDIFRPDDFFIIFGLIRYLPYIAIGLLVITAAIWVVFGIKKLRWAKILAITLTVLVVITGALSLGTFFLGRRFMGEFPPNGKQFRRFEERENNGIEENGSANLIENMQVVV